MFIEIVVRLISKKPVVRFAIIYVCARRLYNASITGSSITNRARSVFTVSRFHDGVSADPKLHAVMKPSMLSTSTGDDSDLLDDRSHNHKDKPNKIQR